MAEYLRMGDYICLFCEDTGGYMYTDQSSSTMDGLFVYTGQERDQPSGVPNIHAITFQVCSVNRFKLTKKYRAMVKLHGESPEGEDEKAKLEAAKKAAAGEMADNAAEQVRLKGKRLRYGDKVQLLHVFTNKYVQISTDNTSVVDKSKMMVSVQTFSSKNAQFKLMPRYKIKVEGEDIEMQDQIVLESVKSPGNFLHVSDPYQLDSFTLGSELNAGVDKAGFTILLHYRATKEKDSCLQGGDVIRLFHKDIEAYLVAEGGFRLPPVEDVHLRIREANPNDPRTLYTPKSGITYWQIELASSILDGSTICWEDSVRFRHMTTRRYLAISEHFEIYLTEDCLDPTTVFKLHSLSLKPEASQIRVDSNARIEHVVTASWLHAPVDIPYEKKLSQSGGDDSEMKDVRWDGAEHVQVAASPSRQYQDAFTLQRVKEKEWRNFNYVAGIIPFIEDLIVKTLKDLRAFMLEEGERRKDRQKLLRNLQVVDVMVRLLQTTLSRDLPDSAHLYEVFRQFYQVLHTYTQGNSRKNSLYAATFIPFFMKQLSVQGGVGLECCKVMIDLIRDNRRIIDRMKPDYIKSIINIFSSHKHYLYLELLGALSVCDGIAMTENQTLITVELLQKRKDCLFHIELGQDINLLKDTLYVSMDNRATWYTLHSVSYKSNPNYDELNYKILTQQLELFKLIGYGRNKTAINEITKNREYFTWEVAYFGLMSELLPFHMRATFCNLLVGLFIDVGDNFSIIAVTSNNFVYDEIDVKNFGQAAADAVPHDFDSHFPSMRHWLQEFFLENSILISAEPGRNMLIKEVLHMVTTLVRYGFMGSREDLDEVMKNVLNLVDGNKDLPFRPGNTGVGGNRPRTTCFPFATPEDLKDFTREQLAIVRKWRKEQRYQPGNEADAIISVKIQALDMIEILLIKEFNRRVRYFVSTFKDIELRESKSKKRRKMLGRLLQDDFNMTKLWKDKEMRRKIEKFFMKMYTSTQLLDPKLPSILFDLTKYPSDELNTKSLSILNKFYTSKLQLFQTTQRSHALLAMESVRVHRSALQSMVILTRLTKSKLSASMADEAEEILDRFAELCHIAHNPTKPHPIGQNILVNNGILDLLLPLVTQDVDMNLKDRYDITVKVIRGALKVLRFLAQENKYVQSYLMNKLEDLLSVQCCGELQALALKEVFRDHTVHCLRLQPQHVQKIVRLAGKYREKAPSFLGLLKSIMKMEKSGTLLKRNQHLVTKYVMENYKSAAYVMNITTSQRLRYIIGKEGPEHQTYILEAVDVLATCAEGENRYIESLCQTLLPFQELINILNNRHIPMKSKIPFCRYFMWAYIRTARTAIESGVDELPHNPSMWKHLKILWILMNKINAAYSKSKHQLSEQHAVNQAETTQTPRSAFVSGLVAATKHFVDSTKISVLMEKSDEDIEGITQYMLKGGFQLLQAFFSQFYKEDKELYPEEHETLRRLASATFAFTEIAGELASHNDQMYAIVECAETLASRLHVSKTMLDKVCTEANLKSTVNKITERLTKTDTVTYNWEEIAINKKMHNFGNYLSIYLDGQNQLRDQINLSGPRALEPYVPEEMEVKIPLGKEFQVHVHNFSPSGSGRDNTKVHSMIDHLEIAAKNVKNSNFHPEEALDIRCLQILRTLIYNKIARLPDNWANNAKKYKSILDEIKGLQNAYLDYDIVKKILPLLDRPVPVAMEVLSLVDLLLFNANRKTQETLIKYFKMTAEEIFFIFVRSRIQVANTALKERRSIKAQYEARKRDSKKQVENVEEDENGQNQSNTWKWNKKALKKKSLRPFFRRLKTNQLLVSGDDNEKEEEEVNLGIINPVYEDEDEFGSEMISVGNYQDGADAVLVFRLMARLCDGQYKPQQDYLRDQPDNLRKVNLVAEVTNFIGVLYTHIDGDTIDLTSQLIQAIQEISMGNQENRAVVLNNKIIDYTNFLLRITSFEGCEPEQVIELKVELVKLIMALIEENGPAPLQIAKEIRDTLDVSAIRRHLLLSYTLLQEDKLDLGKIICGVAPSAKKKVSKEMKEAITEMGFTFYYILARMHDLDPRMEKKALEDPEEKVAYRYFKNQCQSAEVVKDGHLQKVHFRVKNPDLLREEVKEEVKWNIDRTSPSNKLRDLLRWTKDILKDIEYQKRILKNPIVEQLAKRWAIWNYACILLSLVINFMMLVTWDASFHLEDVPDNATMLPAGITDPRPSIPWEPYQLVLIILGAVHNFSSLMLFASYLLLKHPKPPDFSFFKKIFKRCSKSNDEDKVKTDDEDQVEDSSSRLQASLLSAATIYYVMLMALSFAGTFFYGYFFAFHLINIIANNELLKGVVKAVTQNGKSLLWVGIMGLIIIYLYALVAFAFFRASFNEDEEMYCRTLAQCFVSLMRYGVIGDITDNLKLHDLQKNFMTFGFMTVYQLTFFILFTTIGLNVIFGIIVDTFSELRDLKWTAEKDMRDICFICSRDSYDFEHEGEGFFHHVHYEHNMWSYVFYFLHLTETNENDCGAIDLYVLKMLQLDKLDFFPMNRALCLSADEEGETDTKLDDVVATLNDIKERHRREEETRRRDVERRRQIIWQDQFRRARDMRRSTTTGEETADYSEGISIATVDDSSV